MKIPSSIAPAFAALVFALPGCGSSTQAPPASAVPTASSGSGASTAPMSVSPISVSEAAPTLRLPRDTRPTQERIELSIDPHLDRFTGAVEIAITLARPRDVIWLNGKGLHVTRATITPEGRTPEGRTPEGGAAAIDAKWAQVDADGVASLTVGTPIPAGRATVRITYDAAFESKLEGLYKITHAGEPYVFTQFETIAARRAFPCFDEPGIKIPFDVTLVVPKGAKAIANAREVGREVGAQEKVHYAPTTPLPSYLVAFAVGPLDVVDAPDVPPNAVRSRPLKLRGVAPKGRGGELAYALAHTGEILATLERYFGIEYPFDKLDILAVPDKGGAMENAGAITFATYLLLFDEKTVPLHQKRMFARVTAHELAHQWVGDLVTADFWDDIWLNEAFATWLGSKAADQWNPKSNGEMELLEGIQAAMGTDALVSARSVRQRIESVGDIANAFDGITYQKGGGVLAMFERWLGAETFQRGVHDYLGQHRFGSATCDDFLGAMSNAAGKDVKTPFHTFLDQPGVPFIEVETKCDGAPRVHLKQSRYLPLGSHGDPAKTWQVPICARYKAGAETKETCTLLTTEEADLPLGDRCPDWVFPNAEAMGYFRFALSASDRAKLQKGLSALSVREKVAYGNSIRAGYNRGALAMKDAIAATADFANDGHDDIADEAQGLIIVAHDWLALDPLRPSVEAYARARFRAPFAKLGWSAAASEDDEKRALRASIVDFMATTANDPGVRAEGKRRGLAYLGYPKEQAGRAAPLDKDVARIAMAIVGNDADDALWTALRAKLAATEDDDLRANLIAALSSARAPAIAERARALSLDPVLRVTEVLAPLRVQMQAPETREATWQWLKAHYADLIGHVSAHRGALRLIELGRVFCDDAHAQEIEAFFEPRMSTLEGGKRVLSGTVEGVRNCAAVRNVQEPSARELFGKRHGAFANR